jgi:hypothetical protein
MHVRFPSKIKVMEMRALDDILKLSNASKQKRAVLLASLAAVSAILSDVTPERIVLLGIPLACFGVPLLPGIYFGLVVSTAIWLWVSRSIFNIAVIILSTVIAWFSAEKAAEYAFRLMGQMLREMIVPDTLRYFPFLAVCGAIGGLVGSAILTFALSLVCKEFRDFKNWARVVMVGSVMGIMLEFVLKDEHFLIHIGSYLPLFLMWQMTVAATIGYCIIPRMSLKRSPRLRPV